MSRQPEELSTQNPNKVSGLRRKIVALGLAGAAIFGVTACSSAEGGPNPSETTVSAEATTGSGQELQDSIEKKENLAAFIESFEISTEKFTTPEEVTAAYMDRYAQWLNAGLTLENNENELISSDIDLTVSLVTDNFDQAITDQLFTDSPSGQELQTNIQNTLRDAVIRGYWASQSRGDKIPYAIKMEVSSTELVSSDNPDFAAATTFTIRAVTHETDNGNQNIAPYQLSVGNPGQTDIIRSDQMVFVKTQDTTTGKESWKIDSTVFFEDMVINSK